jgi:hypothetical protein
LGAPFTNTKAKRLASWISWNGTLGPQQKGTRAAQWRRRSGPN